MIFFTVVFTRSMISYYIILLSFALFSDYLSTHVTYLARERIESAIGILLSKEKEIIDRLKP